jgi:hypothetical protein
MMFVVFPAPRGTKGIDACLCAAYVGLYREHLIVDIWLCMCRYASLIQSFGLANLTRVHEWRGLSLTPFNKLMDTDSLMKTKQLGIRLADLEFTEIATVGRTPPHLVDRAVHRS